MSKPRMRPLKPEMWQSRDFRALSDLGRLCFIALISHADDEGRLKTDAPHIADTMLMGNLPQTIQRELEHMESLDMIIAYSDRSTRFIAIRNWSKHQRVPHPTASQIPAPPSYKRRAGSDKQQTELDFRMSAHENSRKRSHNPDPERTMSSRRARPVDEQVIVVFERWKQAAHKNGRTFLDEKRSRLIKAALSQYSLSDVLDAVQGWQQIPHNRGENDRHRPFNDIELLLRDARHIETFRDAQRGLIATRGKQHPLDTWAQQVLEGGDESGPQALR